MRLTLRAGQFMAITMAITLNFHASAATTDNAATHLQVDKDGLVVTYSAQQARQIYHYLESVQQQEGFVVSSGAAGSVYLSSPAVTCKRINPGNLGRKINDDSADLYSCSTRINHAGLTAQP